MIFRDRVRWSDVDAAQIVYFGKYIRWVEASETEFFRAHGITYDRWHELGILLARVHLSIDYRLPCRLDDWLTCAAELRKIGGSSLHFHHTIEREGARVADVTLILACLDQTTMKPMRVPAAVRTALAETP